MDESNHVWVCETETDDYRGRHKENKISNNLQRTNLVETIKKYKEDATL